MNMKILFGIVAVLFLLGGCIQVQLVEEEAAVDDVDQATKIEDLFDDTNASAQDALMQEEDLAELETAIEEAETAQEPAAVEEENAAEQEAEASATNEIAVMEGDLVKLNVAANDPDGGELTYAFSAPLNKDGEWQTEKGDAGEYAVTVTVADEAGATASQTLKVVVKALNNKPVLVLADSVTVSEGETVKLSPEVSDEDGDDLTVSYSGWMTSDEKETGFDDAGVYSVEVSVTDGKDTVSQEVEVTVEDKNRAPTISGITLG